MKIKVTRIRLIRYYHRFELIEPCCDENERNYVHTVLGEHKSNKPDENYCSNCGVKIEIVDGGEKEIVLNE